MAWTSLSTHQVVSISLTRERLYYNTLNNDLEGLGQRYGQQSPRTAGGFDVQSMMSSPNMASGGSDNTAHLKGKLNNLNDTIRALQEQLNTHKKETQILRSEKETLESVLTMKQ